MVKLDRIYTRGGDGGATSLGDGRRAAKHAPRIAACGAVDEANCAVGLARLHIRNGEDAMLGRNGEDAMLGRIQNDLFDLGADLATPHDGRRAAGALRIQAGQVKRLEDEIDAMNAELAPLSSFVLPGGSPASAFLHLARATVRRAERQITALAEGEEVNPHALAYANRLSDHLFVMARRLNGNGGGDVLWAPGATRA